MESKEGSDGCGTGVMFWDTHLESSVGPRMEEDKAGCMKATVIAQRRKNETRNEDSGSKADERGRRGFHGTGEIKYSDQPSM